jgi:PAS domain S-box-containing protein
MFLIQLTELSARISRQWLSFPLQPRGLGMGSRPSTPFRTFDRPWYMLPERMLSRSWLAPAVAGLLSVLLLGTLLWFMQRHDLMEHGDEFASDVDSAIQSVLLHLGGDEEFLNRLASDLARGSLDRATFITRASRFVAENPELISILWADEDFVLRWVAPSQSRGLVAGTLLDLPEPERASQMAKATRNPAYTRIFELEMGYPALELYTPVYQEGRFLGVIGGVYSCERILQYTVPEHVLEGSRVSLAYDDGRIASTVSRQSDVDARFSQTADLSSFGYGIQLILERYRTHFLDTQVALLILLCVVLSCGLSYGMWAVSREAVERRSAQEILQRERDNLVNVLEAMEDGVAIVSQGLDVQYVNPILVRDFGDYAGRKCYEYFHGHCEKCEWCMMEKVIAGEAVHSEWCYPRNARTYDLIDTRLINPDGTASKLKIFRDFTERVEGEKALKESEERFHSVFDDAAEAMFLHGADGRIVDVNAQACSSLGYAREELRAMSIRDVTTNGYDAGAPSAQAAAGQISPVTISTEYRRKDGTTIPVEVRVGTLNYGGDQLVLASARDITERKLAEQAIQRRLEVEKAAAEETRKRLAESESLQRVSTALLEKFTLEEVLEVVCNEAQILTRATGSGVLLLENDHFRVTKWTGSPAPSADNIPIDGSFVGMAVRSGEPTVVKDTSAYDLSWNGDPRPGSLLAIPLRVGGAILGVLEVRGGTEGFDEGDTRILSHFADQAAVAIEKARLRQQAEQVAVIEERQRLARELHDSVTQSLYSAALYADAAKMAMKSGKSEVVVNNLSELRTLAREAMLEMRLLIFELHPPALEEEGLVGALRTRLATVETRAGLETDIQVDGSETDLPPEVKEALYRVSQEALNNVIKHAQGSRVEVRTVLQADRAMLEVRDDGCGFKTESANGGMGLKGMKDRIVRLGGQLVIDSSPDLGTVVRAEVPLSS